MERRLSSQVVYEGKILDLRVDEVEVSRNGHHAKREVIVHGEAVAILARDENGKFLFVRQYRYPIQSDLLEIPAGIMEAGETPQQSAERELREETGYRASRWTSLPPVWTTPGFSDEKIYLFYAEGLEWDPLSPDEDEDISLVRLSEAEMRSLFSSTDTLDAKTAAALGWYFACKTQF